jgi:hypothetical protein
VRSVGEVLELAEKVRETVGSWLGLHRAKFVDLDELQQLLEFYIKRDAGLDCTYYIDEYPTTESRELGPHNVRMDVEEAVDAVRCAIGNREVELVYVKVRRGVVEFASGKQFWLIMDVEPYVNEDVAGEE